ncbi:MAG: ABC transporter permease [Gemmataceae bacterium]|nr:ABC transporter permease [Gemmataceae bacterium]MDW8264240.1 hypothetical protein [Gemmataceae bacterium]
MTRQPVFEHEATPAAVPPPSAGDVPGRRPQRFGLLPYRRWGGPLRPGYHAVWPIARVALVLMFRRKLFWVLYALALFTFLMFFFGQYLLAWALSQVGEQRIPLWQGGPRINPTWLIQQVRDGLGINGSPQMYRTFLGYQGSMVMVVLALAGSLLVGNDFRYGSLPFYLSKPISRWHYLLGKCLAVAVFVNMMTTLPAVVLFVQYGLLQADGVRTAWSYFTEQRWLLLGIVGYGGILTVCFSLLLVATACWLRRTVPMIMVWAALFIFCRLIAAALVNWLHGPATCRLIDLWNNAYLLGSACLGLEMATVRPQPQPSLWQAALTLAGVCLGCLIYLNRQLRAVEVVS